MTQRLVFLVVLLQIAAWSGTRQVVDGSAAVFTDQRQGSVAKNPSPAKTVPLRSLDYTTADESNPLPKYLTPAERAIPAEAPTREDFNSRAAPPRVADCPAEYALQKGLFIAWEGYETVLTDLAVGITTGDPEAIVYVVVDSSSEQIGVYDTLNGAGADMSQIEFIIRATDSVWIRDYGPRFIHLVSGDQAIIDHTYFSQRPDDNLFNDYLSSLWDLPQYQIPLFHGGGNFHVFSNGEAFMSDMILDDNPTLSEQEVKDLYREYQNVDLTIYPQFPGNFDWTGHIDMWMLPLDDYKVIIGEYSSSTGLPHQITENVVLDLTSRGYTVYRTPGWQSLRGVHYTYTNAVILNDQVFISKFGGGWTSQDAEALAVFQSAMPDHDIIQVYSGQIIRAAGALHCIVMHVPLVRPPDPEPQGPAKNRYISMVISEGSAEVTAIRVRLTSLHHPAAPADAPDLSAWEGEYRWVNSLNETHTCPDSPVFGTTFRCAVLGCEPQYRDWAGELAGQVLHVTGAAVVPSSQYDVAQLDSICQGNEESCNSVSAESSVSTGLFGNVVDDPLLNVLDSAEIVDHLKGVLGSLPKSRVHMRPNLPDALNDNVTVLDVATAVDALKSKPYGFTGDFGPCTDACPGEAACP